MFFFAPAGLISREAARVTESFMFTVGVGDDFVMRLGVDSIENLRTGIIQTLHASRLPKVKFALFFTQLTNYFLSLVPHLTQWLRLCFIWCASR